MMLSESGDDRRNIMATTIQQIHPVAHWPLVLRVLRRLEVATVIEREETRHFCIHVLIYNTFATYEKLKKG